jgi:glycosyltransferase involved in cell wall biosynthesis
VTKIVPKEFADLSVVIPAFNEAEGIAATLTGLLAAVPGAEVIVIDDYSRDATSAVARGFPGVRVVRHTFNRGQGSALKTGMRLATRTYVAWFDADNEHRSEDLLRIVRRCRTEHLAAVIGQRTTGSASLTRAMGKSVIRAIGHGLKIHAGSDLNCGLRVFRRTLVQRYLPLIPDRFSSSLVTTLVMLERQYPIAFEPIATNPRIGHSTVRMKDGFEAILQLVRAVLLFAPLRVFLRLGGWAFAIGAIYSVAIALIRDNGIPTAGVFIMTTGILTAFLGLIADQISQMRLGQINNSYADVDGDEIEVKDERRA